MLELHEWKHSRAVLRGGGGGDVTSLPDWLLSCISQRGRVRARPDPAGPGVGRGASGVGREAGEQGQGTVETTLVSRVPTSGSPIPLSAMICGPDGGKKPRKEVEKAVFLKSTTWTISAQLLYQHTVKPTVAFHESQAGNRHKIILNINLRRKHGSPNFCDVYGLESAKPDLQSTFKKPGDDPAAG